MITGQQNKPLSIYVIFHTVLADNGNLSDKFGGKMP